MFESILSYWKSLSEGHKLLVKELAIAAIGLYILLHLVSFFLPLLITAGIFYWMYKSLSELNSKQS